MFHSWKDPIFLGGNISERPQNLIDFLTRASFVNSYGSFLKSGYPPIIHFNGIFHYKLPSWGTPFQEALIFNHLNLYHPIALQQWGFQPKKSSVSALVDVVYEWSKALDQGSEICAVFFDLQKAFDSVPHKSLIDKKFGTPIVLFQ